MVRKDFANVRLTIEMFSSRGPPHDTVLFFPSMQGLSDWGLKLQGTGVRSGHNKSSWHCAKAALETRLWKQLVFGTAQGVSSCATAVLLPGSLNFSAISP